MLLEMVLSRDNFSNKLFAPLSAWIKRLRCRELFRIANVDGFNCVGNFTRKNGLYFEIAKIVLQEKPRKPKRGFRVGELKYRNYE